MTKCVIFDPTLASNAGHNLDANIDFAAFLQNECEIQTEIWAADIFDASTSTGAQITPTIPWIYEYVLQTQSNSAMARLQRMARRARERAATQRTWWIPSLALNLVSHVSSLDRLSQKVKSAINHDCNVVFFTNVDFYSLLCIYNLISVHSVPNNLRLIIRLIDVLEHFAFIPNSIQLVSTILLRLQDHKNLIITAETEKHCAYLEKTLGTSIPVSVIPRRIKIAAETGERRIVQRPFNENHATQFVVLCPGSARPDKGYWQFIDIASYLMTVYGERVILAFQQMPPGHQVFDSIYHNKLQMLPNVIMLPSVLSTNEYHAALNNADAILLPYDRHVYRYRGSSAMFDAFSVDKPVIGMSDTGFGQTLETYDLGFTYSRLSDLRNAIDTIMSWSDEEARELQSRQQKYIERRKSELRNIFCGETALRLNRSFLS